jgi:hypothetical protein
MKKYLLTLLLVVLGFSFPTLDALADAKASGLEGEYVEEGGDGTLVITADHWKSVMGGSEDNELYTAKKTGENTYELVFTPTDPALKDQTVKATARLAGKFLFTKMQGSKIEVKWKKK